MNAADDRRPAPDEALAEGFARHVERWARRLGAAEPAAAVLRQVAREVSLATREGHVCLALADLPPMLPPPTDVAALRQTLLGSALVGTPAAPGAMPLILDAGDRLYLHRYFDFERRLARRLLRAARAEPVPPSDAARAMLTRLFAASADTAAIGPDWQQLAVALALRQRLVIVSGGPGTGKTTTVVHLLACLLAQDPSCRIALAAPTGKAAARMGEAIRQRAAGLPPEIRDLLPTESFTIHRLLGVTPAEGGFVHHAGHRLAIDALVVDEASMLDLALATRLLEAVPESARIVLIGDKDQLSAVESGAVFAELCADPGLDEDCRRELAALCALPGGAFPAPAPPRHSPLPNTVVWFKRNHRFAADSGIGRLARAIHDGQAAQTIAWLRGGSDDQVRWLDDGQAAPDAATLRRLHEGYASYLETVLRDPTDLAAILRAFDAFRVLCAVRQGPRGVAAINERISRVAAEALAPLRAAGGHDARSPWTPGRPVVVLRNDPLQKLFNGDIGIALPDAEGRLWVCFPASASGVRRVAPQRMPPHQTAFAMTVHKAQGSEFDEVLVLLPAQRSRVLTRELLYTAVTRARRRVTIAAGADVLALAIESPTRRHSGLLDRLREAAPEVGR